MFTEITRKETSNQAIIFGIKYVMQKQQRLKNKYAFFVHDSMHFKKYDTKT